MKLILVVPVVLVLLFSRAVFSQNDYDDEEEECDLGVVQDIQLFETNHTLYWLPPEIAENNITQCHVSYYLVFVENSEHHQIFTCFAHWLDISYLIPKCEHFNFTIVPVSWVYEGRHTTVELLTPPPYDETYEIEFRNVTQVDNDIHVTWGLASGLDKCVNHYRLSYWKNNQEVPDEVIVTSNSYVFDNVVPCAEYNVQVRSIMDELLDEGPANSTTFTADAEVPSLPILYQVTPYPTFIEMTWNLTSTKPTECSINEMHVISYPAINATFEVKVVPGELFNIIVGFLEPATAYQTQVYVTNVAGASETLNVILQTTSNSTYFD